MTVLNHSALARRYPEIDRRDAGAPPRFEAYAIEVEELGVAKALLAKASIPFRATELSLVVPPSAAFNLVIEFTGRR